MAGDPDNDGLVGCGLHPADRTAWREGKARDLVVVLDRDTPAPPVEPYWLYRAPPGHPTRELLSWQHSRWDGLARQCNLVRDRVNETPMHTVEPLIEQFRDATTTFMARDAKTAHSIAAAVSRFQFAVVLSDSNATLQSAGEVAVHAVTQGWAPVVDPGVRLRGIKAELELMPLVGHQVPDAVRDRWIKELTSARSRASGP